MHEDNPIVVRHHRGGRLESMHRGAWVVMGTDGEPRAGQGDPRQLVFARSATKGLQAIPLVESGALDAKGLDARHVALASASHDGDPEHIAVAEQTLRSVGLDEAALQCGPQVPRNPSADMSARRTANNCSGKHAGFLVVADHLGQPSTDYLDPDGATQQQVAAAIEEMTGAGRIAPSDGSRCFLDGCSAPTFLLPLGALALGMARLTNPEGLPAHRVETCRRITDAAADHPALIAGPNGRISTDLLRVTGGRVFAKRGAEGVLVLGVRGEGVGLAFKIDDGDARGYEALAIEVLHHHGWIDDAERSTLDEWVTPTLTNWDGLDIGRRQVTFLD